MFALSSQPNLRFFPVVPGRLEFAAAVRRKILEAQPKTVAVELPWALEALYVKAVRWLPEMTVILLPDPSDEAEAVYLPVEPADPFTEAVRSAIEVGANLIFVEPPVADRPHVSDQYPDPYASQRIGVERYVAEYLKYAPDSEMLRRHARGMAWRLQGIDPSSPALAVVSLNLSKPLLEEMVEPQEPPEGERAFRGAQLVYPHPDCLAEITIEYPFLQERYEQYRMLMEAAGTDRPRVQLDVLREAEKQYGKNTGDKLVHWQRRLLGRYARNLALSGGSLIPGIWDLTVAARSIVDDNFAWEVWDVANRYPAQQNESSLEVVNLSGEDVWVNTKRMRIRRHLPRDKQRSRPAGLKARKKERMPGEWARQLDGDAICSYPPEDFVIEDYGRFLKQRGKELLTSERERTVPFTTSLLDGIDLRETIRNWHDGKIYVKELSKTSGDVGSIVVIFDEDREDRYRYLTTWLGEHQNESDMAFYSTPPFEHMVGPGIGRAEYGGFLMSLPARRMYDVWGDPDYDFAETKAERLLLAGLDYSVERNVVYVAAKPPRSVFRSIASQIGRRIVYIPMGQLSAPTLKKVRVVHVLDGYHRRETAKDYIW